MSGSSGFSWGSVAGDLSSLVSTAGKDYFNARFSQRNSAAQTPIYTTQSAANPATQVVPSAGAATSTGGSMLTSPLVIGGAVVVVALVAYLMMRK